MNTLAQILALAQRTADREGRPCTVLNLNPMRALYVVRDYPGEPTLAGAVERNGARFLVAVVRPGEAPDMRGGYVA